MTIDQFLEKLRPLQWKLDVYGQIRAADLKTISGAPCCPVVALLPPEDRYNSPSRMATAEIGLTDELTDSIMAAADNHYGRGTTLRVRLLEACGLEERR